MSLRSLPTELIELIASHLDLISARSIRLVCSSLKQQTQHHFRDSYFRQRTLTWTKKSFDALLQIISHLTLGDALQHLIIDATPRHSMNIWRTRKRLSEAQAIIGELSASVAKHSLEEQHGLECRAAEDMATYFNESRYDQKCLTTVFKKLGHMDSIMFVYRGMHKNYGKFGRRYCESSQHEMSRPFISTMAAISSSNIQVKAISLHPIDNNGAVSIGRIESLAPSLKNFDAAFANLQVLKLNLRDWRYPDSGFELDTHRAPFVIRFLAKAHKVKVLELSCYSSLEDDLFGEMARHCNFRNLETCRLSLFRMNQASDLTDFLAPSSSTLRSLTLDHFRLMDEDVTWPSLLKRMARDQDTLTVLEKLELVSLFTQIGSRLMIDEVQMRTKVTIGNGWQSWRDELLDLVDAFVEGGLGPAWHLATVAYPFVDLKT
jgi:hypothetical protein